MESEDLEIVAGTYEELLLGYKLVENDGTYSLEQSFTDHSHTGCVKSVDISRKGVLASGSTDETVRLFNLRKRSELGSLMEHEGAVSHVEFYGGSHLFTASQDKTICIWKTFTWECLRTLRAHKGGINHMSVHPSGKLALSVGQDKCMHTWNLLRGRSAYTTNTKIAADLVLWSPTGEFYVMVINNSIDVYKTETAAIQCSVKSAGRVNAVVFITDQILAYGGDGGDITFYDTEDKKDITTIKTGTNRIRGLACTTNPYDSVKLVFMSVSSDGLIKVWNVHTTDKEVEYKQIAEQNTKFRLTCVAVTPTKLQKPPKSGETEDNIPVNQDRIPVLEDKDDEVSSSSDEETPADRDESKGQTTVKKTVQRKRKINQNSKNTEATEKVKVKHPMEGKKKKKGRNKSPE